MMETLSSTAGSRDVKNKLRAYQSPEFIDSLRVSRGPPSGARETAQAEDVPEHISQPNNLVERTQAIRAARAAEIQARQEAFLLSTQRAQEKAAAERDAAFMKDYQDVLDGLVAGMESNHIMGDTQYTVEHKKKMGRQKQAELHQEWETDVFGVVQSRLQSSVDKLSSKEITTKLRKHATDYMAANNSRGVFRDVFSQDTYNPLEARQHTIRIPTGDITDPLKRDMLKPQLEAQQMGHTLSSPPLGKSTLDPTVWGPLILSSTPYGRGVDGVGQNIVYPPSKEIQAQNDSHIPLDHYTFPNHDNNAAAQEMGRIGKRTGLGGEVLKGRRGLTEVVQQTCQPGDTGGDLWLEAKGKAVPPGPEQRRGRVGLSEVIAQSSNPYKDGKIVGDQWMEARGKSKVASQERPDRADMREVVQQSSNPYRDGRKAGDQWLEARGKAPTEGTKPTVGEFFNRIDCPPEPPIPKDPKLYHSVMVNDMTLHPRV